MGATADSAGAPHPRGQRGPHTPVPAPGPRSLAPHRSWGRGSAHTSTSAYCASTAESSPGRGVEAVGGAGGRRGRRTRVQPPLLLVERSHSLVVVPAEETHARANGPPSRTAQCPEGGRQVCTHLCFSSSNSPLSAAISLVWSSSDHPAKAVSAPGGGHAPGRHAHLQGGTWCLGHRWPCPPPSLSFDPSESIVHRILMLMAFCWRVLAGGGWAAL